MKNDAKSFIVELAPLYVQSVWGVWEKKIQIVKLAEIGRIPLISLLLYIVIEIETRT